MIASKGMTNNYRVLPKCRRALKLHIKAMDQGRPLEGPRVHYDFLLITVK